MQKLALFLALASACAMAPRKQQITLNPVASAEVFQFSGRARRTKLAAIVFDLPFGYQLGEFAYGLSCSRRDPRTNFDGRFNLETNRYEDVFNASMKRHGYPVDDQVEIFKNTNQHVADLQVGARIVAAQINECVANPGNGLHVRGNVYLKVEWSVFSMVEKEVIFTAVTEGTTNGDVSSTTGDTELWRVALGDAIERLALDAKYRQVIDRPQEAAPAVAKTARLRVQRAKAFSGELKNNIDAIKLSVLTVTANKGTGSGFVLSDGGIVLTAAHVVSGSKYVKVNTVAGKECYGEVVEVSKQRDLALIRLDCAGLPALPLATGKLVEGGDVFAIGTPLSEKLQFSVTKGVVSGIRKIDELDYIQSDAKVLPGNSGGPLLDSHGNVVGVSCLAVTSNSVPVGLNFFVPLVDLDKYLAVDLE